MRARESSLWAWLRDGAGPSCMMERVENSIDTGCPDVFMTINGSACVVELKSVEHGELIDCELRTEQASFLRRWAMAGGLAWVLVRVKNGNTSKRYLIWAGDTQWLVHPISERHLARLSHIHPDGSINMTMVVLAVRP